MSLSCIVIEAPAGTRCSVCDGGSQPLDAILINGADRSLSFAVCTPCAALMRVAIEVGPRLRGELVH